MSISASIDFKILNNNVKCIQIVNLFLKYGWTLNDCGCITYLPVGDKDDFDWISEKITCDEIFKIIELKEVEKEIIGIVITWKNTEIGGSCLFFENGLFSFCLNVNRKIIKSSLVRRTDVSWYLTRILPVFELENIQIETIKFEEII